jgi:endonuclease/exonuclease/phosphatase family metal-dependent hydrolase
VKHAGKAHDRTVGVFDHEQWPVAFCVDFIYVTKDLADKVRELRVNLETDASDHQPVLIHLDI